MILEGVERKVPKRENLGVYAITEGVKMKMFFQQ